MTMEKTFAFYRRSTEKMEWKQTAGLLVLICSFNFVIEYK